MTGAVGVSDEHESSEGDCDSEYNRQMARIMGGQMSMNPRKGTVTLVLFDCLRSRERESDEHESSEGDCDRSASWDPVSLLGLVR